MGKYGLAKNILGTVIDKAQVPMKSNREVVDERTTKDVIAAMGAACRALNAEKYALATNIIATQMGKMPHVVDEDITKSMLSALGTAHSAVYSKPVFSSTRLASCATSRSHLPIPSLTSQSFQET